MIRDTSCLSLMYCILKRLVGKSIANIKDIAKKANVSTATVSRYLNNPEKVKLSTRQKIKEVIDQENYYPNGLISAFFKNKTNTIGLIIHDLNNPFFPEMADNITKYANSLDYMILLCNAQNNSKFEREHLTKLLEYRVDGIIVVNSQDVTLYDKVPVPVVSVERKIENTIFFEFDNQQGGRLAANKFIKSNRVLILDGPDSLDAVRDRMESFQTNIRAEYDVVDFSEYSFKSLKEIDLENYDGVFCWNDLAAYRYLFYVESQYNLLKQTVVGFDGIKMNEFVDYSFYTIKQDMRMLSLKLIRSLIKVIDGNEVCENNKIPVSLDKIN